jgi:acyl-CoA thioester hydrolase
MLSWARAAQGGGSSGDSGMFTYTLQPRFSETDGLGHINNAVLPVWLEEARTDIFRVFNPGLDLADWNLILKKYEVDFRAQIWRTAPVAVQTTVLQLGNTSLTVLQRVIQSGAVVAVGKTVLVHFDYASGRPTPIPDAARAALEAHLEPVDSPERA